jgi:hypothetical protein
MKGMGKRKRRDNGRIERFERYKGKEVRDEDTK